MHRTLDKVAQAIYDKKGFNIIAIDVRGISSLTDYFLIAEGNVERHVKALSTIVYDNLAESKLKPLFVEGMQEGDWIVMDYGDFIIHLFTTEMRQRYALEEVWKKGKIVDLNIKLGKDE